jgi:hypothetical protein
LLPINVYVFQPVVAEFPWSDGRILKAIDPAHSRKVQTGNKFVSEPDKRPTYSRSPIKVKALVMDLLGRLPGNPD